MGNMELHAQLTAQMEAARTAMSAAAAGAPVPASVAAAASGASGSSGQRTGLHVPRRAPSAGAGAGGGGGEGGAKKEDVVVVSGLDEYGRPIRSLTKDYKLGACCVLRLSLTVFRAAVSVRVARRTWWCVLTRVLTTRMRRASGPAERVSARQAEEQQQGGQGGAAHGVL